MLYLAVHMIYFPQ